MTPAAEGKKSRSGRASLDVGFMRAGKRYSETPDASSVVSGPLGQRHPEHRRVGAHGSLPALSVAGSHCPEGGGDRDPERGKAGVGKPGQLFGAAAVVLAVV